MPDPFALQTTADVCTAGQPGYEYLYDFQFIKALSCTYFDTQTRTGIGLFATGLFVFGGVFISMYVTQNSPIIPIVLVLVIGGAALPMVAGPGVAIAGLALLIGGAGAATYLWYRFTR